MSKEACNIPQLTNWHVYAHCKHVQGTHVAYTLKQNGFEDITQMCSGIIGGIELN